MDHPHLTDPVKLFLWNDGTVTYGRRRHPKKPHAVPFYSVKTEAEAENLVVMYCPLKRGYYRIWQFRLKKE
jgi:hypothetical protein